MFAIVLFKRFIESLLITALCVAVWRLRRLSRMKSLDKLPGPPSASLWNGNMGQLLGLNSWGFHERILAQYGTVIKIHGLVGDKKIYTSDPRAMYDIMVKYHNNGYKRTNGNLEFLNLIFGPGLLSIKSDIHRKQRKMMNPVFHIAHMKYMTLQFYEVTHRLCAALETEIGDVEREIDLLKWMTRTALELIGQAGLGYKFDPLTSDTQDVYALTLKKLGPAMAIMMPYRDTVQVFTRWRVPRLFRKLLRLVPSQRIQHLKNVVNTMHDKNQEIYNGKKQALAEGDEAVERQIAKGKDIISILLKANDEALQADRLSEEEVLGQMSTIIFAAMDTTSGAMSRILQLLAANPKFQSQMRQELYDAHKGLNNDLPYEVVDNLPLLDACCRETLRLYPPVSTLVRVAQKDMVLPLLTPITDVDGRVMIEIFVPKGTDVYLSIIGINRSKAVWGEDSMEWKPERWLKPHPQSLTDAHVPGVYSNTMTFSAGSTSCIGFKFSQLEMKVVLSMLLQHFSFAPSDKEIDWKMATVSYPCIKGHAKPQMPLRVSRVSRATSDIHATA